MGVQMLEGRSDSRHVDLLTTPRDTDCESVSHRFALIASNRGNVDGVVFR
jgi:hypothetical protein